MEYISGGSLTQLIEKSWVDGENGLVYSLRVPHAMRLFTQIVSALAQAHRLGIVHRDLKPDNVLLQEDDDDGEQAKIVDFGIAKILIGPDGKSGLIKTDAHANLGTALYMAPERFAGAPGDPRLDVYALGLLLHELVTGLLPFASRYADRETPTVLLHKRLTMAVPALASTEPLSPQLVALHADLLDRDPLRRPAHAGEVRQRLRDVPEIMALRMSIETSGASASDGNAPRRPQFSLPPMAPVNRSLSPTPQTDTAPVGAPGSRSLPQSGDGGPSAAPTTRSLSDSAPKHGPSGISLPPGSISLPPDANPQTPASISLTSKSDPQLLESMRSVDGNSAAVQPTSTSVTKWLLAGCAVLIVLLILLALF
jgi:serine/threonine-protein kinase